MIKKIINKIGNQYVKYKCKKEFEKQSFVRINERVIEYAFVFDNLVELAPKTILDIGTGKSSFPSLLRTSGYLVKAIDNIKDYWPSGMVNRHFHIIDDNILDTKLNEKFDVVTCISVLEHIEKPTLAVKNMIKLVRPGGYLFISFPYNEKEYCKNVYELPMSSYGQNNPFVCQSYSRQQLDTWINDSNCNIIKQEYWQLFEGKYWTEGVSVIPPLKSTKNDKHQLTCILVKKNK
jgi:SAM-dependent methyltransferase